MRKNFTLFTFMIILLFYCHANRNVLYAQNTIKVSGVLSDSTNGEILPFGTVFIPELNRGITTDTRGIFLFTGIPAGKTITIIFSYVGYITKRIVFEKPEGDRTSLKIKLSPLPVDVSEIVVEGERLKKNNAPVISLEKITAKQLASLPKIVESDVLQYLKFSAGVQSTGDASARYYVRGGANNQNVVLINDATVYNPYHAMGIFSAVDPEIVSSMEFYKGAYPTEYSGRLSSILNITTKDGNKVKMGGQAAVNLLSVKGLIEGPMSGGSYMISGRKSISPQIVKKFLNDKDYPFDFYDFSFKVNYANKEMFRDAKFTIHGFFSKDNLENNNPLKPDFMWANNILGINYFQLNGSLFYNVSVNYSRFDGKITPNLTLSKESENVVDDVTARIDLRYVQESKNELDIGLKIQGVKSRLITKNAAGLLLDSHRKGTGLSFYIKYLILYYEFMGIDIGSRINLTRMTGGGASGTLEPRAIITWRLSPEVAVKAASGIFRQDFVSVSDENEVIPLFEPWLITPTYLNPSSSIHYSAGIETEFIKDVFINVDGYYKTSKDIAIINEKKILPTDHDLVNGKSEAYGMEVVFRTNQDDFNINSAYSLSWATNEVYGVKYTPRFYSKHNFNIAVDYDLGGGWKASMAWIYTSGTPFTQTKGFYNRLTTNATFSDNLILQNYSQIAMLGDRNAAFLPDYHRLDLTISKQVNIDFVKLFIDLSIINVYNRKNIFYFDRKTGERVNMLPFLPTFTVKAEI